MGVFSLNCITYTVRAAAMIDTEMTTISISVRSTVPITVKVFLTGPAFFFFLFFFLGAGAASAICLGAASSAAFWENFFSLLKIFSSL